MKHSLLPAICTLLSPLFIGNLAAEELPADFPAITVTTHEADKVGEGYIFLAVGSETEGIGTYLMILDNDGSPVWHQKLDTHEIYDFKVQASGQLTCAPFIHAHSYTGGGDATHHVYDPGYELTEVIPGGNGYVAESHDFQVLPNGHILQFGYYMSEVDMSQIVEGGYPAALVSGGVVQELDTDRNVVFQWRTWDHYRFEDATYRRGATSPTISMFHLNTINQDPDGNLIVGTPLEIRKISRQTGEVLWVLGGDENEFTPEGEGADVSHFGGHATYRLENGNFLMYDNGPRRGSGTSTIHEYHLDEINKIATHVWSWAPPEDIKAWHRGNAQRLPNGNTLIGWGGASGEHIPAATEVTPDGEVVFELYFDEADPQVESYRAFRFPWPPADQRTAYLEFELAAGNSYEFFETGVTIDIGTLEGDGYNEIMVSREPYAPVYPEFMGKSPRVVPLRVKVTHYGIREIAADIEFDVEVLGLKAPETLTVHQRPELGTGTFTEVATEYNPVTGTIRAEMNDFGEFIFCHPDVPDVPYPPILNRPENDRGEQPIMVIAPRKAQPGTTYPVNQERHVSLSWSPRGLARWFALEIATDTDFTQPVLSVPQQTAAHFVWQDALPDTTYHYRVKTGNEGGESDWSSGTFETIPPKIKVTTPSGGERWEPGREYFIRWEDNLDEDVQIDLHRDGVRVQTLATTASTGVYEWEVDLDLPTGPGYTIAISSVEDAALTDSSASPFHLGAMTITNIALMEDGALALTWDTANAPVYVDFSPSLSPAAWEQVAGPIEEATWTTNPTAGSIQGYYRLRSE
jgi:hypothetical protein